jgi:hypothetical protein
MSFQPETEMSVVRAPGMSAELVAGAAGVVLGVLALIGVAQVTLMASAAIVFGGALLLGGGEAYRLSQLGTPRQRSAAERAARAIARSTAGAEALVGIGLVVLGIVALTGMVPMTLVLVAVLTLASTQLLTRAAETGRLITIMRS